MPATLKNTMSFLIIAIMISCSDDHNSNHSIIPTKPNGVIKNIEFWLTSADGSTRLKKQNFLQIPSQSSDNPTIIIDTTKTYQSIEGFGYTLTGGSASLIYSMSDNERQKLLHELFSTDSACINISYLRVSIGASSLSSSIYTYDDMPEGETDLDLNNFSIDAEKTYMIPLLKEILVINPQIKILASPWSAPLWMKTKQSFINGNLNTAYYDAYARYFVKYIQAMQDEGISIDAITPQNEPLNPHDIPSMVMTSSEQIAFIKDHLGPAFQEAQLNTKIILYDYNCDAYQYPLDVLSDNTVFDFVDGTAFHLNDGYITALSKVHDAFPEKNIYFTERGTASPSNFNNDLRWHIKNLIIGAPRNWSRNVLEWNLATDENFEPHLEGACTTCLGALTIEGVNISRNVSYYIIAHASKFVLPGSVRVDSNIPNDLQNIAYQRADGKKVLIVLNDSNTDQTFGIKFKNKIATASLTAGSVATYVW
jgi:glucosylceramidase